MTPLKLCLRTGNITLPDDKGNYVISPGCGAGKTYFMVRFAMAHKDDGILIAVDSIKSANTIYSDLISLGLSEDDIFLIHSKTDFSQQTEFSMHPEEATKKKIIIMTNVRLYTEFPPAYLLYHPAGVALTPFDGDWGKLMTHPNLRRYIFIDEIPGFIQSFATVSKVQLGVLSDQNGVDFKAKDELSMKQAYYTFISKTKEAFFDDTTTLGRLKSETVMAIIRRDYNKILKAKEYYDIRFSPCDFASTKSLVLIMEGAGDILFNGSSVYNILDMPNKYDGNAIFKSFNVPGLNRRQADLSKMVKRMAMSAHKIISNTSGKTLVVCWKDLKTPTINLSDDGSESQLANTLGDELAKMAVDKTRFSIIYYGSADSRAVNTFKDYSNIVLLGKWSLPASSSSDKFKKAFKTETTLTRYMLWEYVQLITRTRLRMGQDIKVFYTDDHEKNFISALSDYFNKNKLDIREERRDWKSRVNEIAYGSTQIDNIEKLSHRFPQIIKIISGKGKSMNISMPISEINKSLGQKRSISKYQPLILLLKKFGINLKITR